MTRSDPWFIVFSDDWGVHPSSSQHIFKCLAPSYDIVWINTVGMRPPQLTISDAKKAGRKLAGMFRGSAKGSVMDTPESVDVRRPFMLPFANRWYRQFNSQRVASTMRAVAAGAPPPVVVATVPNACDYAGVLADSLVVYYCVDDFSEWPGLDKALILSMESKLIDEADVMLATSENLFDRLGASGKPTYPLPHGVDFAHFSKAASHEHDALLKIPGPRIGFFGLFDERSNQGLIAQVARAMPDLSIVIAGPVVVDVTELETLPNVWFVGGLPYKQLPGFIAGLEMLLLPYHINALSDALSPLKLKEYLATGKPVLSTPIRATQAFSDDLTIAKTGEEWIDSVRSAVAQSAAKPRQALLDSLTKDSWDARAQDLLSICLHHRRDGSSPAPAPIRTKWVS